MANRQELASWLRELQLHAAVLSLDDLHQLTGLVGVRWVAPKRFYVVAPKESLASSVYHHEARIITIETADLMAMLLEYLEREEETQG